MLQALYERRSIRKYQSRPVPREMIEQVIRAGMLAPSAKNRQPWRFVVTQGAAKQEMLSAMERGLEQEKRVPLLPNSVSKFQSAVRTMRIMEQAPAVIFVLEHNGHSLHDSISAEQRVYERCDMQSIGAYMENMSLAAASFGLGSLWICDTRFAHDELSDWLHAEGELVAAMALGYADEHPPARPRDTIENLVEWRE